MIRRRLFTVVAATSLLLCGATAILWLLSYRWETCLERTVMPQSGANWYWHDSQLWSQNGGFHYLSESFLVRNRHFADGIQQKPGHWYGKLQPLGTAGPQMLFPENLRPFADVGPMRTGDPAVVSAYNANVYVPHWCVLALTIPLPTLWIVLWRRRVRRNSNALCGRCGYNLTGNTSGTCPECGTPVPSKPEAVA